MKRLLLLGIAIIGLIALCVQQDFVDQKTQKAWWV